MRLSAFDLFSIGVGPSSSHTVGPMRAARDFTRGLERDGLLDATDRVVVQLLGSLGATGVGHGTDRAVLVGLEGADPETVAAERIPARVEEVRAEGRLQLAGRRWIAHDPARDVVMRPLTRLALHPNGMVFTALDAAGTVLREESSCSVGGGFVVPADPRVAGDDVPAAAVAEAVEVPWPFRTGDELLLRCREAGTGISGVVLANECARRPEAEVRAGLLRIWAAMDDCIDAGFTRAGSLPGPLAVTRRAPELHRRLLSEAGDATAPGSLHVVDWITLFALAVNEENASGHRVVTAPTNGAAGIVPAVLRHHLQFVLGPGATQEQRDDAVVRFLLTAAGIGSLFKENASISGAEVGCQGEVGSACSMAAAGVAELMGGTPEQVENAAEIGMEHNLGLTCDPVGGLVQIPCIERNAVAAVKAVTAARIALRGDGRHVVSLDAVIRTLRDTGRDMRDEYKETSRGGLAVNVVEC
jgi:L-serine dehydratase